MKPQITDEELEAMVDVAMESAKNAPELPRIVNASYHEDLDLFVLKISDGRRLVLPREELQFVSSATAEQIRDFTIEPRGVHIWWPSLDEGFSVKGLLEGRTGNARWMEKLRRHEVAA